MHPQLKRAVKLIKSSQHDEALTVLNHYLADNPSDATAWWLRSFVLPGIPAKLASVESALALDPASPHIRSRLKQLQKKNQKTRRLKGPSSLRNTAIAVTAGVLVLVGGIAVALSAGLQLQTPLDPLPTLVMFAETTPTPFSQVAEARVPADASGIHREAVSPGVPAAGNSRPRPGVQPVESTPDSTTVAAEIVESTASTVPETVDSQPVAPVVQVVAVEAVTAVPENPAVEVTANPVVEVVQDTTLPSVPPTFVPTPVPTEPPAVVVLENEPGAPLNTAVNIGGGEMRVISATRPAEARIVELGGRMPPAPANYSWVLVEVLLVCQDAGACAHSVDALEVTGSTGTVYRPSSQLDMAPLLGSVVSNGQIWGYVGFLVAADEIRLKLVVPQGNVNHVFEL